MHKNEAFRDSLWTVSSWMLSEDQKLFTLVPACSIYKDFISFIKFISFAISKAKLLRSLGYNGAKD